MDGWMERACICMHTGLLVCMYSPSLSFILLFLFILSLAVAVWVCGWNYVRMCMYVRWGIALDSTQKYRRPWPVFSYCPLFSELPVCHLLLFLFFFFISLNEMCTCIRQLFVLPTELHRWLICIVYMCVCVCVCAGVCVLKNSPNFSFLIASRFLWFHCTTRESFHQLSTGWVYWHKQCR